MNYFGNKLKSKSIAILLITTIIFWLIPPNLIFGESNDNTLELLQQAADRANAALVEAQAAADQAAAELSGVQAAADQAGSKLADARTSADQATKVLAGAEKNLADAQAALDKAAEGDDLTVLEQAVAEALASRDAAKAAADQANAALVDAQAAADRANVALADAQAAADQANAALVEAQAAEDQASAELEAYLVEISGEPEKEIMEANLDVLADSQNVEPGGSITYKITVTNTGSIVLSGIEVLDKLPELVIFESGSTGEFNEDLREVSYTIESLEPGEMSEEEIIVYVPVVAEESQTLTNSVIISSMEIAPIEEHVDVVIGELTEEDGESGEEGNEAEAIDEESQQDKNEEVELDEDGAVGEGTVEELTGETAEGEIGEETEEAGEQDGEEDIPQVENPLYLSVSDSPDPAAAGQNVTYTINYANNGEELLTGVSITSYIPEKTTFISTSGGGELRGGIVVWNIGELAAGESGTVVVSVSIPADSDPEAIYFNVVVIDSIETEPISETEQTLDPATQTFYVFGWAPDILELLSSGSAPSYDADPDEGIHSILSISNSGENPVTAYLKNYADEEEFDYEDPASNEKVLMITIEPGEVFTIDDLIDINYTADPDGNWEENDGDWKLAGGDFLYVIGGAVNVVRGFAPEKISDSSATSGNVLAEFWNLYPTRMWDDDYTVPVGVNTYENTSGSGHGTGEDMEYTDLLIQAMEDGTTVTINDPVNGNTVITLDEGENYIYKSPGLSSYSTKLSNGISNTDTTIPVYNNSQFANSGYIKIDNEIILYTGKTWWYSYTFQGCTRGALGTAPAPHLKNAVVNQYSEYSNVYQNTTISSDKVVQAGLMTSSGGSVDTRNYNLTANKLIGTEYYIPVDTGTSDRLYIYAFEDGTEVKVYTSNTSYKTINLNAGQVDSSYTMTSGKAVYVRSNKPVQVLGAADSNGSDKDWGFQAISVEYYSSDYVTPYAPGNDKGYPGYPKDASWNPLYVTPVENNTRVYVDWNGDGSPDRPNGNVLAGTTYITLNRFQIGKLWDTVEGDGDNGGAYIWAENSVTGQPVKIVVYYGEQSTAHSQLGYDWGYSLIPLSPEFKYDMSLDKEADKEEATIGDIITYTFTVTNTGNSPIYDVSIVDSMFSSCTLISGDTDPLEEGETAVFEATYTVKESDLVDADGDGTPDPIENTAFAEGSTKDNGQKNVFSNEDTETVALIYTASIEIAKSGSLNTGSDGIANPGDTITYTFTVVNTGDVTLTGVTVTDPLVTVTGGPITLAPGETDPDTFTGLYTLTQADIDAGKVDNTATAVGTPPVGDNVTDTDSETVDITQGPAISLVKDVDDNEAAIGQTLSYSYTVENTGNVTLTGVTLSDDILGEVTLGSVALAPGDATTGSATHTVTEANLPGPIVNTATAVGTDPAGGKVTASDTETVALIYTASISVTKTPDVTSATVGDTITYTYTVENTGNVTLTNLEALDNRLGGVTFDKTTLAPNETVTGVLQKVVSNDDLPGPIDNRVDAKALDPVGNEVTDSASATVELYYNPHPPVVTRGSITLNKSGLESTDVAGFTLYDSEGDAVGGEKTITGNGTVKWSGLRRDTYKIVETTVPSGYLKMDDITDIVISSSKLNHSFDRTNTKVPSTAMIQVLGIQELPFTGLNPAIPISGIFIIIAGLAMVMLSLKRNKYNDLEDKSN